MYWKYHEKAAEKGVYIIGSSGFDSIPADLGVIYTRNKMNGKYWSISNNWISVERLHVSNYDELRSGWEKKHI